jgi:hypothetical protein
MMHEAAKLETGFCITAIIIIVNNNNVDNIITIHITLLPPAHFEPIESTARSTDSHAAVSVIQARRSLK